MTLSRLSAQCVGACKTFSCGNVFGKKFLAGEKITFLEKVSCKMFLARKRDGGGGMTKREETFYKLPLISPPVGEYHKKKHIFKLFFVQKKFIWIRNSTNFKHLQFLNELKKVMLARLCLQKIWLLVPRLIHHHKLWDT